MSFARHIFTASLLIVISAACHPKSIPESYWEQQDHSGNSAGIPARVSQTCGICHVASHPRHLYSEDWEPVMQKMADIAKKEKLGNIALDTLDDSILAYYKTHSISASQVSILKRPAFPGLPAAALSLPIGKDSKQFYAYSVMESYSPDSLIIGEARSRKLFMVSGNRLRQSITLQGAPMALAPLANGWLVATSNTLDPLDNEEGRIELVSRESMRSHILMQSLNRPVALLVDNLSQEFHVWITEFGNQSGSVRRIRLSRNHRILENTVVLKRAGCLGLVRVRQSPSIWLLCTQGDEAIYSINPSDLTVTRRLRLPPSFGATALRVSDFDQDGKEELLVSNGDSADLPNFPAKPNQGIRFFRVHENSDVALERYVAIPGVFDVRPVQNLFGRPAFAAAVTTKNYPNLHGGYLITQQSVGEFSVYGLPGTEGKNYLRLAVSAVSANEVEIALGHSNWLGTKQKNVSNPSVVDRFRFQVH